MNIGTPENLTKGEKENREKSRRGPCDAQSQSLNQDRACPAVNESEPTSSIAPPEDSSLCGVSLGDCQSGAGGYPVNDVGRLSTLNSHNTEGDIGSMSGCVATHQGARVTRVPMAVRRPLPNYRPQQSICRLRQSVEPSAFPSSEVPANTAEQPQKVFFCLPDRRRYDSNDAKRGCARRLVSLGGKGGLTRYTCCKRQMRRDWPCG